MKEFSHRLSSTAPVTGQRGFALVVTMTLLVLLTVLALGMLSLSAVSLRTSSQDQAITKARANARMALMIAIGQLQEQLGPDQRVNATASSIPKQLKDKPVIPGRGHWLGVYDSWDSASAPIRPEPSFRRWLVSGPDTMAADKTAPTISSSNEGVVLWKGIEANGEDSVVVPKQEITSMASGKVDGALAWWVGDENSKALIDRLPQDMGQLSRVWSDMQSAPVAAYQHFPALQGIDKKSVPVDKLVSHETLDLLALQGDAAKKTFHDFTTYSQGVLSDVARGGLKRDLSLFLDHPVSKPLESGLPNDYRLYDPKGITWEELWLYHNLWRTLEPPDPRLMSMTGGDLTNSLILMTKGNNGRSVAPFRNDPYSLYKLPVYVRAQWLLSTWAEKINPSDPSDDRYHMYWVSDAILTFWNPYDVPLALHPNSYMSFKFWTLPYSLRLTRPDGSVAFDQTMSVVLNNYEYGANADQNNADQAYTAVIGTASNLAYKGSELSKISSSADPVVLMPGEVLYFSQEPTTNVPSVGHHDNRNAVVRTKVGWNLGKGLGLIVRQTHRADSAPMVFSGQDAFDFQLYPNNHRVYDRLVSLFHCYGCVPQGNVSQTPDYRESLGGREIDLDNTSIRANTPAYSHLFPRINGQLPRVETMTGNGKHAFFLFNFQTKTEDSANSWSRMYEPRITNDEIFSLSAKELAINNNEFQFLGLSGMQDSKMPQLSVNENNRALFGGSYWDHSRGVDTLIAFSVPREPPVSLGAFQHAIANGLTSRWTEGSQGLRSFASNNTPEISRAISNSYALPVLTPYETETSVYVDHSYHVNRKLWDSWFLSGISQRQAPHHSPKKTAREVYADFVGKDAISLANRRMKSVPGTGANDVNKLFESSGNAKADAYELASSKLMVHGAFNVNSSSVEAWKAILGSMESASVPIAKGPNSPGASGVFTTNKPEVPVASLLTAYGDGTGGDSAAFDGAQTASAGNAVQWRGNRRLTHDEIEDLAEALVDEIRTRGPFLSMADFVNRRPNGDNTDLALCGPIQSALDRTVNKTLLDAPGRRGAIPNNVVFPFPEAAQKLPKSIIGPAHVQQADILTSIGSQLAVHSDTFRIRAYGESRDTAGKVLASAWCEVIVQRVPEYVDPTDPPEAADSSPDDSLMRLVPAVTSMANQKFGRRFKMQSFRWLSPSEIQS